LFGAYAEPQLAREPPRRDERQHDEGDAHEDADRVAAHEQEHGPLPDEHDVQRERGRDDEDADARAHAGVTPATCPETSPSATGGSSTVPGTRTPRSMKLSRPTRTPCASRAARRAMRMPGAYARAGSIVSCVMVTD